MQIKRRHVDKLLSSNSQSRTIGKPRADRHHLGMRSGAHLESSAHKRGHDSDDEPLGASESKRDRRATRRSKRKVAPSRADGVDRGLAGGERGASGGAAFHVESREAEPVEGLEAGDAEHERPQVSADGVYHTKVLLDKSIIDKSIIQYCSDKSITRQKYYSELKPTNTLEISILEIL